MSPCFHRPVSAKRAYCENARASQSVRWLYFPTRDLQKRFKMREHASPPASWRAGKGRARHARRHFFATDRALQIDRSIDRNGAYSVTVAKGGLPCLFITVSTAASLKGTAKSTCRPPCATKNQSSLYRLQDRHQRSMRLPPSRVLSHAVSSSILRPHGVSRRNSLTLLFIGTPLFLSFRLGFRIAIVLLRIPSLNGGAKVNGIPGEKASRSTVIRPERS